MAGLEVVVMLLDARSKLHFFYVNVMLFFLRFASSTLSLVLVLSVIHQLDNGRAGFRSDFHKVQTPILCEVTCLFDRNDTDLATHFVN